MSADMNRELLTMKQVAEQLGCSMTNVYTLVSRGLLPVIRVGQSKGYRVDRHDLAAFLDERRMQYETVPRPVRRPQLKHIKL
ncbi:MAG: helix-turn-helix domain-containing protein [Pirellulales bacterium]|nr:helix-turn-helix domain-containing protein [Pirellulales bacterium]